jgi:LPXTG-site transpeptidase (sortase) family protein
MQKHNKKQTPTKIAFIGALIIIVGGFFLLYDYIESKKVLAYDYISNYYYNGKELVEKKPEPEYEIKEEEDTKEIKEEQEEGPVTDEYIGYLTIPKINLTKGFVDKRSSENDVEKNILVIEGSNYPDVERGNFILAGHSGTGWKAFFNELYQLTENDEAYVTYKGKKYIYKVVNIYTQPKVGTVAIYRNYDKTTLTLITCTNNDQTTQTIYILELTSIEE